MANHADESVAQTGRLCQDDAMDGQMVARNLMVSTVDYHTAGEPFRIVSGGVPALRGKTILEKRRFALEHLDHIRQLLVYEPRGHADMYGGFVTEAENDGAQLGVVFFHNAGYSTACGHGTIALVTWALQSGRVPGGGVPTGDGEAEVVVDAPSGRLRTWAVVTDGGVRNVRFRNVPAFVLRRGVSADGCTVDVAYGGAFYAIAPAPAPIDRFGLPTLIERGRRGNDAPQPSGAVG